MSHFLKVVMIFLLLFSNNLLAQDKINFGFIERQKSAREAREYIEDKQYEKALRLIDTLISKDPDNFFYHKDRAIVLLKLNQTNKVPVSLLTMTKLSTNDFLKRETYYFWAVYSAIREENTKAFNHLKNAVEKGFVDLNRMEKEMAFEKLKKDSAWEELALTIKKKLAFFLSTENILIAIQAHKLRSKGNEIFALINNPITGFEIMVKKYKIKSVSINQEMPHQSFQKDNYNPDGTISKSFYTQPTVGDSTVYDYHYNEKGQRVSRKLISYAPYRNETFSFLESYEYDKGGYLKTIQNETFKGEETIYNGKIEIIRDENRPEIVELKGYENEGDLNYTKRFYFKPGTEDISKIERIAEGDTTVLLKYQNEDLDHIIEEISFNGEVIGEHIEKRIKKGNKEIIEKDRRGGQWILTYRKGILIQRIQKNDNDYYLFVSDYKYYKNGLLKEIKFSQRSKQKYPMGKTIIEYEFYEN